jgi:hypothetical protein
MVSGAGNPGLRLPWAIIGRPGGASSRISAVVNSRVDERSRSPTAAGIGRWQRIQRPNSPAHPKLRRGAAVRCIAWFDIQVSVISQIPRQPAVSNRQRCSPRRLPILPIKNATADETSEPCGCTAAVSAAVLRVICGNPKLNSSPPALILLSNDQSDRPSQ